MKIPFASAAVLLTGVCLGLALGARLATRAEEPARHPARQAPATRDTARGEVGPPPPASEEAPQLAGEWVPAGRYVPLVGRPVNAAERHTGADTLMAAPTQAPAEVDGREVRAVDGAPARSDSAPRARVRPGLDDPGPLDAAGAGRGVLLALRRAAGRVAVYEALDGGDPRLPADISGRWAVADGCGPVRVDLSQKRGPAGALRGVGRSTGLAGARLVVPAGACGETRHLLVERLENGFIAGGIGVSVLARPRGVVVAAAGSGVAWESSVPGGAVSIRPAGALRANGERAENEWDAWFVGFDSVDRPLSFIRVRVARGRVLSSGWIPLGGARGNE